MYLAIFIFIILIVILAVSIEINVKSANDTIKIDAKIGLIRFVIPHQRLLSKAMSSQLHKSRQEQKR